MRPSAPYEGSASNATADEWEAEADGYVDEADLALYRAAHGRYCADLQAYGVTHASCRATICPEAAQFFDEAPIGGRDCE